MKNIMLNVTEYFRNGIEQEIEELESNGDIIFTDNKLRDSFVSDLLSEMIEQYENNTAYYVGYSPNFADSVADKIHWDNDYYKITVLTE